MRQKRNQGICIVAIYEAVINSSGEGWAKFSSKSQWHHFFASKSFQYYKNCGICFIG